MIKLVCSALSILVLAAVLDAQCTVPPGGHAMPEELVSCAGVGCSYGWYTSQAGNAGCWGAGQCNPAFSGRYVDVSWNQWWSCSAGNYVSVKGSSYLLWGQGYDGAMWRSYPNGMMADGTAYAYADFMTIYQGWDEDNCDGHTDYSGQYSYDC
jgi:hypothetical protein